MSWRQSSRTFFSGGHTLCVITAYMAALCFRTSSPIPAATPAARTPVRSAGPAAPIPRTAAPARAPAPVQTRPARSGEAIPPAPTIPAAATAAAAERLAARRRKIPAAAAITPVPAAAAGAAITLRRNNRRLRAPYIPSRTRTASRTTGWLFLSALRKSWRRVLDFTGRYDIMS